MARILQGCLLVFITLLIVECFYRFQWVDFYANEWRFQNQEVVPRKGRKTVLVFGDSFSADPNGWVTQWRKSDNFTVYNAAVPGIGPETHRLLCNNRVAITRPNTVIVQLYEGNDLYDVQKPVNWERFSTGRNLFWTCTDYLRCLQWMNYRLGQKKADLKSMSNPKKQEVFHTEAYDPRTRLYISGDREYPQSLCFPKHEEGRVFQQLTAFLHEMKAALPTSTTFKILLLPHCVQVHSRYLEHYRQLGARLDERLLQQHPWKSRLEKEGFEILDPLPYFRTLEAGGNRLYFANDQHLSPKGQDFLTRFIQTKVQ